MVVSSINKRVSYAENKTLDEIGNDYENKFKRGL